MLLGIMCRAYSVERLYQPSVQKPQPEARLLLERGRYTCTGTRNILLAGHRLYIISHRFVVPSSRRAIHLIWGRFLPFLFSYNITFILPPSQQTV